MSCPSDMVAIPSLMVCIDRYEASRADATGAANGTSTTASSRPFVRIWQGPTPAQATTACSLAGKRLCSRTEWQAACEGGTARTYPYGNVYDPAACHVGTSPTPPDGGNALVGGNWPACQGGVPGLFDMAGGWLEMHSDVDTTSAGCTTAGNPCRRASGSAYFHGEPESRCSYTSSWAGSNGHVGFRCCRDSP